jgi:hypothetical protein
MAAKDETNENNEIPLDELFDLKDADTKCCLCSGGLEAFHKINFQTLQIDETLRCPNCEVTLKNSTHTLH